MPRKKRSNTSSNIAMILIVLAVIFLFIVIMTNMNKDKTQEVIMKNNKEHFEEMKAGNNCGSCNVRNQG